ncbi:cation diffusion facilitator family transporter [Kutzneria viridogrisea]|uniref:Cation diffusion facilitator family transporter n=1 Tax=Kutzneria viridogrisea TaxID=47990 RepID=A0ABR6BFV9_9PSEU|nr:cation diffusion facilitator family transporter [Kutzneria viridogrisea]
MGTGHGHGHVVDAHLASSRSGMRALWGSFAVLILTSLVQGLVVLSSGSVALLSDTLHNLADAFSALPLVVAFTLGRRVATRRFTYGFGRAEDLAGLAVLALIAVSAVLAVTESVQRLVQPQAVTQLPVVAAAAVLGFVGNEAVARWRIRVGRRIGSAALVADGMHARVDGFTSLAVLVAAGGSALGWGWVDPLVGLGVAVLIVLVLVGAGREVLARLMDAADPTVVDLAERLAGEVPGVLAVEDVRLRWSGHGQLAELTVVVDRELSLVDAHCVAHEVEHHLLHGVHRLVRAHVHPHPGVRADEELVAHQRVN